MDLRTEKSLYRKGARLLARASLAPPVGIDDGTRAEWLKERLTERTIKGEAVADAVRAMLVAADLLDSSATDMDPAWVLVEIVDRLTVEGRRKPGKRGRSDG